MRPEKIINRRKISNYLAALNDCHFIHIRSERAGPCWGIFVYSVQVISKWWAKPPRASCSITRGSAKRVLWQCCASLLSSTLFQSYKVKCVWKPIVYCIRQNWWCSRALTKEFVSLKGQSMENALWVGESQFRTNLLAKTVVFFLFAVCNSFLLFKELSSSFSLSPARRVLNSHLISLNSDEFGGKVHNTLNPNKGHLMWMKWA